MLPDQPTTANLALRCYAPPFVADAWRLASSGIGGPDQVLYRRLALGEVLQRTLVALLASQLEALDAPPPPPDDYTKLLGRLTHPTWGDWGRAAAALAKALFGVDATGLSRVLWRATRRGVQPTDARRGFDAIVACRNRVAHPDSGQLGCTAPEAREELRALAPHLRAVVEAMRALKALPVYALDAYSRRRGATFIRFAGTDTERLRVEGHALGEVEKLAPFVLAEGRALYLAPWIELVETRCGPSLRLLAKRSRRGEPLYSDPADREGQPSQRECAEALPPLELPGAVITALQDGEGPERLDGVGPHRFVACLGAGGSGRVFLTRAGRAVKVLHRSVMPDARQRRRLRGEYQTMARLSHPGICQVFEHGDDGRHGPFVVMEYIDGADLHARLRAGPLPLDVAARVAEAILDALAYTHDVGVVHRDIKPGNVLLDSRGHPRLVDFGVGRRPRGGGGGRPARSTRWAPPPSPRPSSSAARRPTGALTSTRSGACSRRWSSTRRPACGR